MYAELARRAAAAALRAVRAGVDRSLRPTGRAGRTFSAVAVTLGGVGCDAAFIAGSARLPGLRGGFVEISRSRLELRDADWIRGVRVSDTLRASGTGTLTVAGPAAAEGTLTYTRRGVRGTLGAQTISAGVRT